MFKGALWEGDVSSRTKGEKRGWHDAESTVTGNKADGSQDVGGLKDVQNILDRVL